eukprot:TRINITY_DN28208_c0_g1_i1.p3 TRINITY_DN28208_c0_g1~~TRINITY_DN28208_c0_g1_i1.p3  ORF type:complete len:300 (+),score=79.57 TRINITY_DN28208_c0_g1_i1:73-972(+)
MSEKGMAIVVDLGCCTTKLGVAGHKIRREDATSAAMRRELEAPGMPVHAGTLGMYLRKMVMRHMQVSVDTVQVVVAHNTAGKASLPAALTQLPCLGITVLNAQACALAAAGSHTGLVLDIGEHEVRCVPVVQGCVLVHGARFAPLGAALVQDRFAKAFKKRNRFAECKAEYLTRHGRVAATADGAEAGEALATAQALLDVPVSSGYEVLFDESEPSPDSYTLHGLLLETLAAASVLHRAPLAQCVVLAGGVANAPGLPQRLAHELCERGRSDICIARPPFAPSHLVCTGASLLHSIPSG